MKQRHGMGLRLFLTTAILLLSMSSYGQVTARHTDTLSLSVYFRQAKSEIDLSYRDNRRNLSEFISKINVLNADPNALIQTVNISTGASPEGTYEFNQYIARARAHSIRDYLLKTTTLAPSQIRTFPLGVDWDGFEEIISKGDDPDKDRILDIIRMENTVRTTEGKIVDIRTVMLSALDGGEVWRRLNREVFDDLRQAGGRISCVVSTSVAQPAAQTHGKDTLVIIHRDTVYSYVYNVTAPDDSSRGRSNPKESAARVRYRKDSLFRTPVLAFRSNLLVPLMNLGVEVPLGNRWSLEADFYNPWVPREWMNGVLPYYRYCAQVQAAYLCSRLWLGSAHSGAADPRYRLRGHSLGFGFGALHYDVGADYRGQQSDALAVGIDYKYAQPLGRGRVHLEFTAGVCGYYRTYENYFIEPVYSPDTLLSDGGRHDEVSVAPFKLGVSLVVPIFRKTKVEEGRQ